MLIQIFQLFQVSEACLDDHNEIVGCDFPLNSSSVIVKIDFDFQIMNI